MFEEFRFLAYDGKVCSLDSMPKQSKVTLQGVVNVLLTFAGGVLSLVDLFFVITFIDSPELNEIANEAFGLMILFAIPFLVPPFLFYIPFKNVVSMDGQGKVDQERLNRSYRWLFALYLFIIVYPYLLSKLIVAIAMSGV